MLLEINGLLNEAQIEKIRDVLAKSEFKDGRLTAGTAARQVKENEELAPSPDAQQLINRILMASIGANMRFNNAAMPNRMANFIIARYQPGMYYGDHIDEPVMGAPGPKFRTDISMTVFLNPPETYDGGELVIRTTFGEKRVKLAAGDAVFYPSSSLHHVAEVTSGERLVALTWIQSQVRDPARREILFDLVQSRDKLLEEQPASELHQSIDRSYANLMRMWSEI